LTVLLLTTVTENDSNFSLRHVLPNCDTSYMLLLLATVLFFTQKIHTVELFCPKMQVINVGNVKIQ